MRLLRHLAERRRVFVRVHDATPVRFAQRLQMVFDGDDRAARQRHAFMSWDEPAIEYGEPFPTDVADVLVRPDLDAELPREWAQQPVAQAPPVAPSGAPPAARPVRRFVPAVVKPSLAAPPPGLPPLEGRTARLAALPQRLVLPQQDRMAPAPYTPTDDMTPPNAAREPMIAGDVADPAAPLFEALLSVAQRPMAPPRPASLEAVPAPPPRDQVATTPGAPIVAAPSTPERREPPAAIDAGDGGTVAGPRWSPAIDEPHAELSDIGRDRSVAPPPVPLPVAPRGVPMPEPRALAVPPAEPTRSAAAPIVAAATRDASPIADAVLEGGDVGGEPEEREDVAVVGAASEPHDTTAPRASEAPVAPVIEPAARASRRSRVEELPAEALPDRRAAEPPDARRAEPTAAGRTASGARQEPGAERETAAADQLFRPVDDGVDRSPAALGARLAAAFAPPRRAAFAAAPLPRSTPPAAAAPRPVESRSPAAPQSRLSAAAAPPRPAAAEVRPNVAPIPTPPDTARLLTPLVGVDPVTVTVLQGPDATAATAAMRADALAVGTDTVVVGPTFTGTSPRDVGLLAHELTHIARAREPRFVPPIARPTPSRGLGDHGEEDVARRVEARVATVVNGAPSPPAVAEAPRARRSAAAAVRPERQRLDVPRDAHPDEPPVMPEPPVADEWGGLPAPWEPLPQWLAPASPALPDVAAPLLSFAGPDATTPSAMVSSWGSATASPVVHAADESRTVDAGPPAQAATPAPAPGDEAGEAGPDLDWLARQVYSALKRRLGAEARRENLF